MGFFGLNIDEKLSTWKTFVHENNITFQTSSTSSAND